MYYIDPNILRQLTSTRKLSYAELAARLWIKGIRLALLFLSSSELRQPRRSWQQKAFQLVPAWVEWVRVCNSPWVYAIKTASN